MMTEIIKESTTINQTNETTSDQGLSCEKELEVQRT